MAALSVGVAVALGVSFSVGAAGIPLARLWGALLHGTGAEHGIVMDVRLPRIALGFSVGGALALAGVILQGMFRNPLVEPYTIGISGGAALGVSLGVICGLGKAGGLALPLAGFSGSLCVLGSLVVANRGGGETRLHRLLLNGVMISFIASSLVMLIMALARPEDVHGIVFWIMGSLDEPDWFVVKTTLIAVGALLIAAYPFCRDLNALALGEEEAAHLGVCVDRSKWTLFVIASLLAGFCVSVAGMIGFVGLVVPHLVRVFVGGDHRVLMPAAFLAGGGFLVLCDTVARTIIAPVELPVGVVTGIVGGGLFVWALAQRGGDA